VNDVKDRRLGPNLQNHFKIPVEWRKNISCNDAINSYDYVASVIDEWVWGTGGMTTTGVKRGTRKKPLPRCHSGHKKMPHGLSSERTRTSAVTGRRLTPLVTR